MHILAAKGDDAMMLRRSVLPLLMILFCLLPGCAGSTAPVVNPSPLTMPRVVIEHQAYNNPNMQVDVAYPRITGMADSVLEALLNHYIKSRLENLAQLLEQRSVEEADQRGEVRQFDLFAAALVNRNDGCILSLSVRIGYYAGGASSGSDSFFINVINEVPGRQVRIGELFLPESDYISLLNARVAAWLAADPWLGQDNTFTTIGEDQWFYLTDSSLVIVFPRYAIACGAAGELEFPIPLVDLEDVLIPALR